jgi:hypothetical protein
MTLKMKSLKRTIFFIAAFWFVMPNTFQAQTGDPNNVEGAFSRSMVSQKAALIVVGPSVSEKTTLSFGKWGATLYDVLLAEYGYLSENIRLLYVRGDGDKLLGDRVLGNADLETLEIQIKALSKKLSPGDQVSIFLIGHGTGSGAEAKFNIVGPDITGGYFDDLLMDFSEQDLVVVDTTSASYGFARALSDRGRVVVSATRSASEKYDPVFAQYFVRGLEKHNADRDKNGRVSFFEAFYYARVNVMSHYEDLDRLASEHAGLDDNGDNIFSATLGSDDLDGRLAEIAYVDASVLNGKPLNLAEQELQLKVQLLERKVFNLRARKLDLLEDNYWLQMEALLIDLARTTEIFLEKTSSL